MNEITVGHGFQTAHRLPELNDKCVSLHGHSWWVDVSVGSPVLTVDGTVVEFGPLKARLRNWLDTNLDHGTMLGWQDPLCVPLLDNGCKVYEFGHAGSFTEDLPWPTVENVAALIARVSIGILAELERKAPAAEVTRVRVQETPVNAFTWSPE